MQGKFKKAVQEKMDTCVITGTDTNQITARIHKCDRDIVWIKILDGKAEMMCTYKNQLFDLAFVMNRTSFQLQHMVLEFMEEHSLFKLLIAGPQFEITDEPSVYSSKYSFS